MRNILLNPGPVSLSEGVRRAAVATDLCHREEEFFDLQDRLRAGLLGVYGKAAEEWSAVLLGGSGTTAIEAMVVSLIASDARVLVLENGVYGERLSRIAEVHGIAAERIHRDWTGAWDLEEVARVLGSGAFSHVLAVHHETTTGRLNPVGRLSALCQRHGADLLLDSVSSFGAEEIPFSSPALIACAATANKCLHGITGLCLVLCRSERLRLVEKPRSLTLHLPLWADHQAGRSTPFTPPVNAMQALDQALIELQHQGGWKARQARYLELAETIAGKLERWGVEPLIAGGESSCVLRAYRLPAGLSYETLHDGLKRRGFVIYAGQGPLAREIFRISTMGEIGDGDLQRLLDAMEAVLTNPEAV